MDMPYMVISLRCHIELTIDSPSDIPATESIMSGSWKASVYWG